MQPPRHLGRWVALAAAALVAVAALVVYREMPRRLAYEVEGASPSDGGYLQGTPRSPVVAHFTDGTEVRVNAGARARIVDVESHGARVALEQGRAHLRVVHLPEAHWSVDAGPFSIAVTGTEFDAEWSAADGVLVVEMRSGAVIVRGPLATDGVGVHGGQRLVASVPDGRLHIEPLDARTAKATTASAAQLAEAQNDDGESAEGARALRGHRARGDAEDHGDRDRSPVAIGERDDDDVREPSRASRVKSPDRRTQAGKPATSRDEPREHDLASASEQPKAEPAPASPPAEQQPAPAAPTWAKRVAGGDFRGVLADAQSRGLAATLAEAPLGDLVALADAARYTGSSSIARDALLSQRKRYPSSADAKNAAFLLGRIAEEGGATGEAIEWYERYLSEAPRGAFAAEALGREMLATGRARGAAAAAVVARRYLERFPGGAYADRARKLLAAQ